jgi:hypothetical protein
MKEEMICMAFVLAAITANAQVKKNDHPAREKQNGTFTDTGKGHRISSSIGGQIIYPKSIGAISNFEAQVKSALKLYSCKILNGQLQEKKPLTVSAVKVTNVTRTDGTNYIYTFEVKAVMPYNQPIEIEIPADWSLPSGKHFFISKTDPNEYATVAAGNLAYTGFDFTGRDAWHPH